MRIVVVGAGQAGAALAAKLRMEQPEAAVTLIGAEPEPPYQRPPLSKAYLLGEMTRERLYLRPASYYTDNAIALITGKRVTRIERARREVVMEDGATISYDVLALTTGALPRHLPATLGGNLEGVHVVRTLGDVDAMAPEMVSARKVLIVGGGYIGLEAAAVARKCGMEVTLIEAADRILARVACAETADVFRDLHRGHGVAIREATSLSRLVGGPRVNGAVFDDGSETPTDMVITGIGVMPDAALAKAAGLEIDNGIAVDERGRTSDPAIWAAGDCASFPWRGGRVRLESVQNAIDHAECVAINIAGAGLDYDPNPWFWSDQYDMKLQIAGLNTGWTHIVRRDGARDGTGSHWYYRDGALVAVDAMNDPRAYMVGKRMIEGGQTPDPSMVADAGRDLRVLLAAA